MRRRVGVQKAAAATASAEPQTHRLTDIEVKEVSFVDRPANRRKFLVVKREQRAKEPEPMKISPEAKTELQDKIKGILEAAGAVSKSLETAEAAEGAPTPAELTAALETMGKLLGVGATATAPQETEKAKPPLAPKKDDEEEDEEDEESEDVATDEEEDEAKKKAKGVAKAGKKMARGRKDQLAAAVNALTALLAEVDDVPKAQPATKVVAKSDDSVNAALRELSAHVAVISKAVSKQKERLDQIAKSSSGSRQVSTEKAGEAEVVDDISWPMDMNKPRTRENTPVDKSFF